VNAEISQFICDYFRIFKYSERNISSTPLNVSEEKGTWDKNSSTYRDIYDDDEYNDEEYDAMTMMITHMTMKSRLTTGIMDPMPKMKWGIVTMI
jgi:hypothetical protein